MYPVGKGFGWLEKSHEGSNTLQDSVIKKTRSPLDRQSLEGRVDSKK